MRTSCVALSAGVIAASAGLARAQSISETFTDITTLVPGGWYMVNQSEVPASANGWIQGTVTTFPANSGSGYIASGFEQTISATVAETINCWLVTPTRTLQNGDTLDFFARALDGSFPDRLQVRMSLAGASTNTGVGFGAADVGDFTTLLLDINPGYLPGVFVNAWTHYTITVSGLAAPTSGRLAFRYFVESAGFFGTNSDYIGVDDVNYIAVGTPAGACCFTNGDCISVAQVQCASLQGVYRGDGVLCVNANCPQPGACCLVDGSCIPGQAASCAAAGGTYRGDGSTCATANCPQPTCFTASALNVPIGDGSGNGTSGAPGDATLVVPASATITGLLVGVDLTHSYQGDIGFRIVHPDATSLDLVLRPGVAPPKVGAAVGFGFSNDNFGNNTSGTMMVFADSATGGVYDNAVGFPGPPAGSAAATDNVTGLWKAAGGSLASTFGGKNINGTWHLIANDYAPPDVGTIHAFKVCLPAVVPPACYVNCDASTIVPCLNVQDFSCFLNKFAAQDTYANCDTSTIVPVLNVQDFSCFLNKFASGCSSC